MKIIDLLTPNQLSNINELIKSYSKNNEFEVSLFSNRETSSHLLTLDRFNDLNSILTKITSKNDVKYTSQKTQSIDVTMSIKDSLVETKKITNYRITIDGLEAINKYMSMLHGRKNHLVISVLANFYLEKKNDINTKITMMKKTKNVSNYILLEDIYMKVKLDNEEEMTEEEIMKLSKLQKYWKSESYTIGYRFKERTSYFIIKDKNIFRIDLTTVKSSNIINNIESSPPNYEIEIESDIKDKSNFIKQLFDISEFIIKSIQSSNYIITKSLSDSVLDKYRELLLVEKTRTNLYARQPISLEVQHLVDHLPNKYSVTDKADGERNYMLIYNGRCFLISTNLIVKDIGLEVDNKLSNTILDGEFIFLPKYNRYMLMCFDCVLYKNQNIREEAKLSKRLEYLDEIVYQINKCNYKHKSLYDAKIDFNNMDKIIKFHKTNLIEFYNDIQKELNIKSISVLVRRKYFIEVFGTQDNEIFKYTSLMWNMFLSDTNLKCPYLLDGLIFQPNEQKYIADQNKSKLHDYKWKPPVKNSIDFYIEFEKDKKTGKILTIYDNSIKDIVKNKQYQIANLYVGLSSKGIEKPVLFGENNGVSQAYIYTDDNGIPRSQDGRPIIDKTVVEFYYNLDSNMMNSYKWVCMKTRWDKTESVQKFGKRYGNALMTANNIWRSITNPVIASNFETLSIDSEYNNFFKQLQSKVDFDVIKLEKQQNIYFQKKEKMVDDMAKFHHWIKSNLIYTYMMFKYNDDIQTKVLDFGCGRGGDILKFYMTEVELYVGIEPDYDALVSSDGAIARYINHKKGKARFPPMFFIQAYADAYLQYDEQIRVLGKMNQDMRINFNKFFTWDNKRTIFDRADCQFAIHYFLSSESSWNNFCENLNKYLREGGYFVFTTFDGNKVKDKLKNIDKYTEYYDDNGEKKILFELVKKYDDKSNNPYANALDVHMGWMFEEGIYQTEYLVYPEFVIKSFKDKCSMELVETCGFEEIFNDNREFLKVASEIEEDITSKFYKNIYKFYNPNDINSKCYNYSFLNRMFVFRKKETDLAEVKAKFYDNRKRYIKGTGNMTAKSKVIEKKKIIQEEVYKENKKKK